MGALRLNTKREYTFKHRDDDYAYSLTMKFPSAEDIDYTDLDSFKNSDGSLSENGTRKATIRTLRQSITAWTGFEDIEGVPLVVDCLEEDDKNSRAVFDVVLGNEKLFGRILEAYSGLSQKN